jgi:hypothetical protein
MSLTSRSIAAIALVVLSVRPPWGSTPHHLLAKDLAYLIVQPWSEPAPAASAEIGYVGCSATSDAVEGYHEQSTEHRLWPVYDVNGAALTAWANPGSRYWERFDAMIAAHGTPELVWVQLCLRQWRDRNPAAWDGPPFSAVEELREILKAHAPGIPVVISGLNSYEPHAQTSAPWGYTRDLAGWAVHRGLAGAGPALGPLTKATMRDDVHANDAGRTLLGAQLVEYFDGP